MKNILFVVLVFNVLFHLPLLSRGEHTTQDIATYKKYAEEGNPEAQVALGLAYAEASGVPEDRTEAVKWWRMAAEQGYADAQLLLGLSYASGQGVPEYYKKAVEWITLAAAQGNSYAQDWLEKNKNSARTRDKFFKASHSCYEAKNMAPVMDYVIGVAKNRIDLIEEDRLQALVKWVKAHTNRKKIDDKELSMAAFLIGVNAYGKEGFQRQFQLSERARRAGKTFTEAVNGLPIIEKNEPLALERGIRVRDNLITLFRKFCAEDPTKLTYDEMALILRRQGVNLAKIDAFIIQEKEKVLQMVREPLVEHYREIDYKRAEEAKIDARFEDLYRRLSEEISALSH